jgi:hypothetical protein
MQGAKNPCARGIFSKRRVIDRLQDRRYSRRQSKEAFNFPIRRNAEGVFPSKLPSASLNISTYIALYNYGYRNVYELRDTLELSASRLEFEPALRRK